MGRPYVIRGTSARSALLFAVVIMVLAIGTTYADVPSHCLKWQVIGTWDFKMSGVSDDPSPTCGHTRPDDIVTPYVKKLGYDNPGFDVVTTGTFTLKSNYSDEATLCINGQPCEDARWTMVYDEAMSIKGSQSGLELLFQFMFKPKSGGLPSGHEASYWMSYCDQTYPGWFGLPNKSRGCAVAKNQVSQPPQPSVPLMSDDNSGSIVSLIQSKIRLGLKQYMQHSQKAELMQARAFERQNLEETAALINKRQKFWVADASAASFASDFSNSDVMRSVGGFREKLLKPRSFSLDSILDPVLKAKEQLRRQCIRKVLPTTWDWSENNLTATPVIDQGACGSCYAVSSADAFSSRLRLKLNDPNMPLRSAKAVVQCSTTNQGCDGGFPWLMGHHAYYVGMASDKCMGPYETAGIAGGPLNDTCSIQNNSCASDIQYAKAWGYVGGYYGRGNTEDMMWSLFRDGPIVVAVNAQSDLLLYRSGLFVAQWTTGKDLSKISEAYWEATTHAIALVGYGSVMVEGQPIESWKLKNSWGENWGEKGYFQVQRGTDAMAVESMPVHAIFGDGKPGNPIFEQTIRTNLQNLGDDSCTEVIEEMLAKELV